MADRPYVRMLLGLLPPGRLWSIVVGGVVDLVGASAAALERFHARVDDLRAEALPSTATELLPDYEADLAITPAATVAERRAAVVAKTIRRTAFRPQDVRESLAPLLGLAPADVQVIERTRAYCIAIGDDRAIFEFFVRRDPALAGTAFFASAQAQLNQLSHSHTLGNVIESTSLLCDDPHSLCDRDLLGA